MKYFVQIQFAGHSLSGHVSEESMKALEKAMIRNRVHGVKIAEDFCLFNFKNVLCMKWREEE